MIIVKKNPDDTIEQVLGNPTLTSLDGETRATLRTILAPSWTAEERARFGIYAVEPLPEPPGKHFVGEPTYEMRKGVVVQVRTTEDDAPQPEPETGPSQVEALLETIENLSARVAALESRKA